MFLLKSPMAMVVIIASLLGLLLALAGWIVYILTYRKRDKLAWSNTMRVTIGVGGTGLAALILMVPAAMNWLQYKLSVGNLDEALVTAAPDQKAALMARAMESALATSIAANLSEIILLIPCAVLAGLALTVPFFLTKPQGGES